MRTETIDPFLLKLLEHQDIIEALTDQQAGQLIKILIPYFKNGYSPHIEYPAVKDSFEKINNAVCN